MSIASNDRFTCKYIINFSLFSSDLWNCFIFLQDKKSVKLGPDDYLYVEGFASNLFAKADKQDRAGRADLYT